ncbi:hypothetical protein DF268_22005 [Streptomyces sp. V2]|nr:hypothetical protein DF268_22005 [Streptomyces sp. V2]
MRLPCRPGPSGPPPCPTGGRRAPPPTPPGCARGAGARTTPGRRPGPAGCCRSARGARCGCGGGAAGGRRSRSRRPGCRGWWGWARLCTRGPVTASAAGVPAGPGPCLLFTS